MNRMQIDKALAKLETQLEKVRGKEYDLPWQSMRRAKVSRSWDKLAQRKMELLRLKEELPS